jgi:protein-tyrosine phosphatase
MIDLHCHILPGIDDGPKSMDQSLAMACVFEQAGYEQVVATPHAVPGTSWMPSPATIRELVAELNQALRDQGILLTVLPGMEIALDPHIPDLLEDGRIQSLADTSYVLIEPPFQRLPLGWEQVFFELTSKGYKPLLAHPERCAQLADKPELFEDLISMDIRQVNWGSFLGHHGSRAKKTAVYLASKGYIHCLATDSHRPDRHLVDSLEHGAAVVEEFVGPKNLELLARENPLRVLRGEPLIGMAPDDSRPEVKRRRRWGILWSTDYVD